MIDASITKGKEKLGTKSTVLSTNERRRRLISRAERTRPWRSPDTTGERNSTNRIEEKDATTTLPVIV